MRTFRFVKFALTAILLCLYACSSGGDDPIEPTPQPEVIKSEITIDSSIISNGLSFANDGGEQSISFSTNENWTLSIANTTSGTTWCTASATSGTKGSASVKFTIIENTSYEDRSVSVTIKSGTASKTFTITQKSADALLVTTDKYEVDQKGCTIEIEVKANIDYKMEISETAKSWITESSSRALTTHKHTLNIAANEDVDKREGEISFKSGDKVEIVKVYQSGGAIILLSQNEYTVSDAGETISVEIKSNVEFGVQMPDVDWITDEASSRGMSSHTLKYVVAPNEGYDNRSAEIIFYDKNSDLKETLTIAQAQKDAIVISEKNINVTKEGGVVEVKVNTNVNFEVQIPSEVTWISQTTSRSLSEKSVYLTVDENTREESRSAIISIINKESKVSETITIIQQGNIFVVTLKEAGSMKTLLGDDYLSITSLKVIGPINGDDIYYLRKMLGNNEFSKADKGKLAILDLGEAEIVKGGGWYYEDTYTSKQYYTSNDVIGDHMFSRCDNLEIITLPQNTTMIGNYAFNNSNAFSSIAIGNRINQISDDAFTGCELLKSVYITDLSAWYRITFTGSGSNPLYNGAKLFLNNEEIKELVIPNDIKEIKKFSFYGCTSLISVKFNANIYSISSHAFGECSSIIGIDIPDNITSLEEFAFVDCSSMTTLKIGNGVTSIGNFAFSGCKALTTVILGNSLKSIGDMAFRNCRALSTINLNNNITSIGGGAFEYCSSLTTVTIPNGITTIQPYTFNGCSSLVKITIPEGVTSIGNLAFAGSNVLTDLYCHAITPPTLINLPFYSYDNKTTLHVPVRCISKYKSSDWSKFFKEIVEIN